MNDNGYVVVPNVITSAQAIELRTALSAITNTPTRTTLSNPSVYALAITLARQNSILKKLVPVLSRYFPKSQTDNWFVAQHRDETLPIQEFFPDLGWSNPTIKEGISHAKAPRVILRQCLAVRLQLTDTEEGALKIQAGSHLNSHSPSDPIPITVPLHGGLFMNPLLVHSSSKIQTPNTRREVLHVLYGPESLPEPFKWHSFAA